MERVLHGTAASGGVAIGVVAFRRAFPRLLVRRTAGFAGVDAEKARARDVIGATKADLTRLERTAASEIGEEQAMVFTAHLMVLDDPAFTERLDAAIGAGRTAAAAIDETLEQLILELCARRDDQLNLQDRVDDLEDLRTRLLGHALRAPSGPAISAQVVVSPRATPSLVVEARAQRALGIASEIGGSTSHGILLARSLGVPAVTGVQGLMDAVEAGDLMVVDGDAGVVIVRPRPESLTAAEERASASERTHTEYLEYRDKPATSADGVRVCLQANVAVGVDIDIARVNRAEGIGLYRTEVPFILREALPTIDEQVRIYEKAYEAFPEGPISFRVLDLAGDKFLPLRDLVVRRDAFHGYRSIRLLFDYPDVLRDQAQAFAIAARERPLRILVPMVSSVEDLLWVKRAVLRAIASARVKRDSPPSFGVMIEVPAAVELVHDLAAEADFFSIGTNDLIQYALVVDRDDARLSSPRNAFQPAILRMIRRIVHAGHAAGKEVAVCGDMAATPELAIALVALGVDALSVPPRDIPQLKHAIASVHFHPLVAAVDRLLALVHVDEVERFLCHHLTGARPRTP